MRTTSSKKYLELKKKGNGKTGEDIVYRSAENFSMQTAQDDKTFKEDVLVIDQNLKGLDFKLANAVTLSMAMMYSGL